MKNSKCNLIKISVLFSILFIPAFSLWATNETSNVAVSEAKAPGHVTIDFKDAEISSVLRVLSAKSGVNIVAGKDVTGTVTIRLVDVPWEKALDVILRTYGYAYEREGNIIRVTTIENLAKEELTTEVFPLNYAKAEEVSKSVEEMLTERGRIKFDERTNLVIVTDIPTNIYKIGKVIKDLDSQTPQVEIEVKVIETSVIRDENLGVDWTTTVAAGGSKRPTTAPFSTWGSRGRMYPAPTSSVESDAFAHRGSRDATHFSAFPEAPATLGAEEYFQFGTLDFTGLQATMQFLFSRSDTEVLSNPKITTLNNQPAKITVGTKWPVAEYAYSDETGRWVVSGWKYIEYGILLEVTPIINKDNFITLKVRPEVSDKEGEVTFEGAEVPILTTKEAEAQVMIKDGETVVIGGLMKDKVVNTKRKIPLLGDIPIIGLLFSKKEKDVEKRNLIIFITPRIIKPGESLSKVSTPGKEKKTERDALLKERASQKEEQNKGYLFKK
jgi:type IV pilus assembly protein PilQ